MWVHVIILLTRSGKVSQEFFNNCHVAFHGNVGLLFALLYCAKARSVIKDLHIFRIVCHDSVSCVAPRSMHSSQMSCKTNKNSRLPGHPNCFHITLQALSSPSTKSYNRQQWRQWLFNLCFFVYYYICAKNSWGLNRTDTRTRTF